MTATPCIMVVDDDEGTRKSLTLLLKRKGFETEHAETGKEALAIAQGKQISLALLDVKLPDIMGTQLLAPLKQTNPDMSIIMITGFASVENAVLSLTAGASGYITKPIDLDGMLARIKTALDHQRLVTEVRQAAVDEERASLEIYDLYNNAPCGYHSLDHNGVFVNINDTELSWLGHSREEIIGRKKFADFITEKSRDNFQKNFPLFIERGSMHDLEFDIIRKDGNILTVLASATAIKNPDGSLAMSRSTLHDITERKRADVQREMLIAELKQKNAELERFTYTVSHDLKSPLITIKLFAGLLEDYVQKCDPVQMKKDARRITDAADTMQALLSDLLELSRIGKIVNPPEKIGFSTIVDEAVDLLAGLLNERCITVEIAPNLPVVNVDNTRIREVMVNLIENAIKFLGDRPDPVIRIGVDDTGETPVFFVQDNGIGIDPRYLERIFNLFERLDAHAAGTGIGLTIVRRIIEVHGGKIWAESEGAGKGTTFRFTLPVAGDTPKI